MDLYTLKEKAAEVRREYWGELLLSNILTGIIEAIPVFGWVIAGPVALGNYENADNAIKGKQASWKNLYKRFSTQFESSFLFVFLFAGLNILVLAACAWIVLLLFLFFRLFHLSGLALALTSLLATAVAVVLPPVSKGIGCIGLKCLLEDETLKGDKALKMALRLGWDRKWEFFILYWSYIGKMLLFFVTAAAYGIVLVPEMSAAFALKAAEIYNDNKEDAKTSDDARCAGTDADGDGEEMTDAPENTEACKETAGDEADASENKAAGTETAGEDSCNAAAGEAEPEKGKTDSSCLAESGNAEKTDNEDKADKADKAVRICPVCGSINIPSAKFCQSCGKRL